MSFFSNLRGSIEDGRNGKNEGLVTGYDKLDKYISVRKKMMISVIGSTGSGKSSFVGRGMVINPLKYAIKQKKKVKCIWFAMERSIVFTHAKQLIGEVFRDHGVLIDIGVMLGWYKDTKISSEELSYVDMYQGFFDEIEQYIIIHEGQRSPEDIYRIVKEYFSEQEDPQEQVIIVVDHVGLTKVTKQNPTKKQAIDRLVEYLQVFRDVHDATVIPVAQLNRDLSNPLFKKMQSFEPHIDNIKETGNLAEASDIVLSLFEPLRYGTEDKNYGDVTKFRCPDTGNKFFRSLSVLKNTYGADGVSIGTVFHGASGLFKELPKAKYVRENWKNEDFVRIFKGEYFIE